jgi:hypothetical protein
LKRPCRDFLARGCNADDAALSPAPVRDLEGVPHDVDVSRAVKGVVVAPLVAGEQFISALFAAVDEGSRAHGLGQLGFAIVQIDANDVLGARKFRGLKKTKTA